MDIERIRQTLNLFRTDNGLFEVRVLNTINGKENYAGIFDNDDTLIKEISRFDKVPYNIYFTFNELKDAVNGMAHYNKLVRGAKTINDDNVKYRRWMFIDLDPIREGGVKEIASTDEEMEASKQTAREVRSFLKNEGFPSPVVCESGNGTHLLYKLDNIPNDKRSDDAIKSFVAYLSMKYSTSSVDIDIKVKNASRITKLYGTISRKGGDTPSRPHRQSKIIVTPPTLKSLNIDTIQKIADKFNAIALPENPNIENKEVNNGGDNNGNKFSVDEFLAQHGIIVEKEERLSDGSRKLVLQTCPFNEAHGHDSAIFVSEKGIVFTCFHAGCSGKTWHDLRLKFDPNAYDRKPSIPQYNSNYYKLANKSKNDYQIKEENKELGKKWFSMRDIKRIDLSNLFCIKTGYTELDRKIVGLFEGEITLLSGSNSSGKSSWINNVILNVVQQGVKTALWSGELPPEMLKNWLSQCACGKKYLVPSMYDKQKYYVPQNISDKIDAWLDGKFFIYNNDYSNKWQQIFNDMKEMVAMGVKLFILDNLFSLDIDIFEGDKNNKQKELILQLCDFVKKNKIHLILVCHPRKVTTFLRKNDISGTSDLGNAASNILICHRVNQDFTKACDEFFGAGSSDRYKIYDGVIEVCKNRLFGVVDFLSGMYYEPESRRLKNDIAEHIVYGWEEIGEQSTIEYDEYVAAKEEPFSATDFDSEGEFNPFDDMPDFGDDGHNFPF